MREDEKQLHKKEEEGLMRWRRRKGFKGGKGSHSHRKTGGIQMRTSLLGRRARAASTMPLSRPSGRREIDIEDIVNLRAEEVNVRKKGKG